MRRRPNHLTRPRGIALISTVLLTILAASVVLVITTQSIDASRTASNSSDSATATQAVGDAQRSIETWLEQDPYAFFSSVSPLEDARVCDGQSVQPGVAWSLATCGTAWTYETPTNLNATGTTNSSTTLNTLDGAIVQVQLQPPTSASPFLIANITAQYGQYNAGVTLTYRMTGAESYTIYSSSPLNLNYVASGCSSACSTLTGTLYSDGAISLPTTSAVTTGSSTQIESEVGFSPTLPPASSTASYYAAGTPTGATGTEAAIGDIRTVTPTQLTLSSLRASVARNSAFACPGSNPVEDPSDNALSSLCLDAGLSIPALYSPAASGPGTVTVPSNVTGFELIFNDHNQSPAAADTVSVYYATSPINPSGNCSVSCNLMTLGAGDVAANTSPGEYSFWSSNLLGVFTIPRSGLIYTSANTYLSLCGSASSNAPWDTYGGTCPALTSGYATPGMTVGQSATVIAGSAASPANIYLSGSISTAPGVSFGAIASGSILVPYWSHSPGTTSASNLSIAGAYAALGYNDTSGAAIATFPTSVDSTIADNVGNDFTFTGSLAGPSVDLSFNMFSQVALQGSAQLDSEPPPYFADFSGSWALVDQTVLPTVVTSVND